MESKKILWGLCLAAAVIAASAFAVFYFWDEKPDFGQENPENQRLVCEIIGYTNAVGARLNAGEPVPDYITEKYGTIYIPPDLKTYDLVEFDDFGLKQDNTTSLLTRIYDDLYNPDYNFTGSHVMNDNLIMDTYSGIIRYVNDSESAVALLIEVRDVDNPEFSYFILNVNFQSEFGDNFGIYIKPVQDAKSAMSSSKPLYIVYSSKDVDHDYRLPVPVE
ncbi:hypothetical protein [Methanochimaera problematica]|nr:hypothetical protein [Methanoplanus sp. FWC-SCC4]